MENEDNHNLILIKNLLLWNFIVFIFWLISYIIQWILFDLYHKIHINSDHNNFLNSIFSIPLFISYLALVALFVIYILIVVYVSKFRPKKHNWDLLILAYIPIINLFIFFPLITSKKYKNFKILINSNKA